MMANPNAMSKRLRFEVLRRDNHTCRYCGRSAPDVTLHVDHVVPVALGGTNVPENLVTACRDCNIGKASVAPGSPLVHDVASDALRWARAADIARAQRAATRSTVDAFSDAWNQWGHGDPRQPCPMDDDWRSVVAGWLADLDIEDLLDAIPIAMRRPGISPERRWRYFCGIAWNLVDQHRNETAAALRHADDSIGGRF